MNHVGNTIDCRSEAVESVSSAVVAAKGLNGLDEKVAALRTAATYPGAISRVSTIETHFAWVFLVGEHAYKLKKPVVYPGMDLRPLSARRVSCEAELRLNRRLAPSVYFDVVSLVRTADGALRIGTDGQVVDWLVHMRRLPADAMLDRAIADRVDRGNLLTVLGTTLARFYRAQPRVTFDPGQYTARIAGQIHADRRALCAPQLQIEPRLLESAVRATWSAFCALESELARRAAEDRIVEAHGDLRPEHICLEDPPCVIDSLEFSKDLRTLDPAEELGYLWIECEEAGDLGAAREVLEGYRSESGDPVSDRLLDFYRSRRSLVRAKIIAWHLCDPAVSALAPWREKAEVYVARAERYARLAIEGCAASVPDGH